MSGRTRLYGSACFAILMGVSLLVPGVAQADMVELTDPSQISGSLIDFEGLDFGQITDPNVLLDQGVIFPFAPEGDFVVFFGENRLIDVEAAPAGNSEIYIEFVNPVEAAGIEYLTAVGLTFIAYANSDFTDEIGSTLSFGSSGFFGIASDETLIRSILIHDTLGSFSLDDLRFGGAGGGLFMSSAPAPGALVLALVGLGFVGMVRRRFVG